MKIFVADRIAEEGIDYLEQQTGVDVDFSPDLDATGVSEHIHDCDAVIIRSATTLSSTILDKAAMLRVIGRAGIGVDNIDIEAATERGVVVLNTPDANATTTAELAIAHMLSLARHLPFANQSVRSKKWERQQFIGAELANKTLGIIGFGTIGRIVAQLARGLGMRVIAHDPYVTDEVFAELGVQHDELDDLLQRADIVTLHCPLVDNTRHLLNRETLQQMKPGSRLINCARGGLVDEAALYDALESGHIAGAALDVFETEPPLNSPLLELDNIVFTPHLGASTEEAQTAVGVEIAKQIMTFLKTGEAINAVNMPRIPADVRSRLRPWQKLAHDLGRILALMSSAAIDHLEVSLQGEVVDIDCRPVAIEALVGLLGEYLSVPVNQVNATHLAKRQGLEWTESRSSETRGYLSVVSLTVHSGKEAITLAGTLFDERHPRLIGINAYRIEAPLSGNLVFTRHADQPGVIGAIGSVLGGAGINISHMEVGNAEGSDVAVAVIGISSLLDEQTLHSIRSVPSINKVLQVTL